MFYSNGAYSLLKVDTPVISGGATPPSFHNIYSYQFDGVDDYIDCGDNDNLSFGNGVTDSPFSISLWLQIGNTKSRGVISKYGSLGSEWLVYMVGSQVRFLLVDPGNGSIYASGNTTLSLNTWYHVGITYDGNGLSGINIYINGIVQTLSSGGSGTYVSMSNTNQSVEIGKYITREVLGKVDEVAIFNSELSQGDITAIYGSSTPTSLSSYSSLVSWWRMGESANWDGSNWTLTDQGSGGNDATTQNMAESSRVLDVPT